MKNNAIFAFLLFTAFTTSNNWFPFWFPASLREREQSEQDFLTNLSEDCQKQLEYIEVKSIGDTISHNEAEFTLMKEKSPRIFQAHCIKSTREYSVGTQYRVEVDKDSKVKSVNF